VAAISYSARLGALAPDQFGAALARFGLGRFVRAEPIAAGLFGQNVFVTSTAGEWVLRGAPHYPWQFPAERFFARLLHERTRAPVPWPYLLDPAADIFGWSYVLMPRMPGLQLSDRRLVAGLGRADRLGIARALGENLALMQDLTWPTAGEYDLATDTIRPLATGHGDWVRAQIRDRLARAREHNDRTTEGDLAWAGGVLAAAGDALDAPFAPCFVMRDYKEHNATAARRDGAWRVSGVFDLMEGHFGDGESDLCRQLGLYQEEGAAELARAFARAYLDRKPPRPGFARRLPVYLLRDRLIIWEYCQRPDVATPWDPRLTLREWAAPSLAALSAPIAG
jgi:hypothetical protein